MSLSSGSGKLNLALKALLLRWEETQGQWNDPVSQAFDENHYRPLESQLLATLRALDRLAQILDQARKECSEGEW
jgi:hypothetical protein